MFFFSLLIGQRFIFKEMCVDSVSKIFLHLLDGKKSCNFLLLCRCTYVHPRILRCWQCICRFIANRFYYQLYGGCSDIRLPWRSIQQESSNVYWNDYMVGLHFALFFYLQSKGLFSSSFVNRLNRGGELLYGRWFAIIGLNKVIIPYCLHEI